MRICLIVVVVFCCWGCSREETVSPPIRPVRFLVAKRVEPYQRRIFSGITKAGIESNLSFRVPGRIERRPVKVGDRVEKGEMIAELEQKDYVLNVEETEATLFQAAAEERKSTADYARIRELYETESASRAELDAARASYESAKASLDAAHTRLDLAQQQLSYTTLSAPETASVAALFVEVNENVAAGQKVALLNYGENLEVVADIPESLIGYVRKGEKVSIFFDVIPYHNFPGEVSEVGITSPGGTTFPIIVKLLESSEVLRSGLTAEIELLFPDPMAKEGIYVPSYSVREKDGENYVFVIQPTEEGFGVIEKRVVEVDNLSNEGIRVKRGVHEGEYILTAGIQFVEEGEPVKLAKP